MVFSHAIVLYDVLLFVVYGVDFIAVSRHDDKVIAKAPLLLMLAVLVAVASVVAAHGAEFVLLGVLVAGAAGFGYANLLAFVKRGVTFSILSNHTRPPHERIPDEAFIAIDERLLEMRDHGWVQQHAGRWDLTRAGWRVTKLRAWLMRVLRIEAVG